MNREKIDEITNFELSLVIMVVIVDRALPRLLVDEKIYYEDTLGLLNLKLTYLDLLGGEDMLAFNNSATRPCGAINLTLSIK